MDRPDDLDDGAGLRVFLLHNSVPTEVTELAPSARASAFSLHAFSFFMDRPLARFSTGLPFPNWSGPDARRRGVVLLGAGIVASVLLPKSR